MCLSAFFAQWLALKEVRLAMQREIVELEQERRKIQRERMAVIEAHRASLLPEVAAKRYRKTIKKSDKS